MHWKEFLLGEKGNRLPSVLGMSGGGLVILASDCFCKYLLMPELLHLVIGGIGLCSLVVAVVAGCQTFVLLWYWQGNDLIFCVM